MIWLKEIIEHVLLVIYLFWYIYGRNAAFAEDSERLKFFLGVT